MAQSSRTHRMISGYFTRVGLHHRNEVQLGPFMIDIVIGNRLAVEVDGPHHFFRETNMRTALSILKTRVLEAMGWKVVHIHHDEWAQCVTGQKRHLYCYSFWRHLLPNWGEQADTKPKVGDLIRLVAKSRNNDTEDASLVDIERRFSTDRLSLEEYEDFLKTVSEHYLDPSQVTQPPPDAAFDAIPANAAADAPQQLLEPSSPPLSPFDPTPSHMLGEERPRDKIREDDHAVTEATRAASQSAGPREKRKRARQEELVREVEALMSEADAAEKAAQSEEAPPGTSRAHPVAPPPPEDLGKPLPRYHRQAKDRRPKATAKDDAKNEAEGDAAPAIEGLIDRRAAADTTSAVDLSAYRSSDRRERMKPRSGVHEMDEDLLDSLDELFKPPPAEPQRRAHEGGGDDEASETEPAGGRGRRKKREASEVDLAARKMAKEEKQRAEESGLLLGEVDTDADSDEEQQLPATASLSDRPAERTTAALPPFSSLPPFLSHEQAFDITSEMLEEERPATTLSLRAALSSDGAPSTAADQRNGDSYDLIHHGPPGVIDIDGGGHVSVSEWTGSQAEEARVRSRGAGRKRRRVIDPDKLQEELEGIALAQQAQGNRTGG